MRNLTKLSTKNIVITTEDKLTRICKEEQERVLKNKKINIITSYLLATFQISPNSDQLVLILAKDVKNNNREALSVWVSERLEKIDFEDHHEWSRALSLYLSDIFDG
ncbi:hypothetical protein [Colwellia sp. E2M01]|uniref:hypothetical protein n=1 Tax=Colwellia sp. E2M01 TaxID=2841561 RepID=UPI001C08DFCF|nr:hypothetical protein [Colwellia sp. E2M01]MBU2869743.1 hypothetical protein [Colwellia sp. E2M01]